MASTEHSTIKDKTIKGLFWSGIDKFAFEIIHFVIGVVMARMLMPSDYGIVGILLVFISFSTLFIDGGLATALIQKKDREEKDYNTAFVYNLISSIAIYIILFLAAPYIARVYNNQNITSLLRVLSLNLIIASFSSIQNTKLTIEIDFKKISIVSVVSGLVSGVCGVCFAYYGWGVWALVMQQLISNLIKTILLNVVSKWHPSLSFSKESFKELFNFGSKLIVTNIIAKIYDNLYPIVIGKIYPLSILGYYTRAHQYAQLPANTLKDMFMRVSFPVLSSIQDDSERLKRSYRIYIKMSSFVIFPLMFILIVISKPLIILMLTEKWSDSVPFLQILSLGLMFSHISAINLNLLFVKGRSDLALKLEILKKIVAILIFVVSTFWGIWGICIGQALYHFIAVILNSKYTYQLISLPFKDQLKDFGSVWLIGAITALLAFNLNDFVDGMLLQILWGVLCYFVIYCLFHYLLKTDSYKMSISTIKDGYLKR